jgi:hypothetical protein
MLRCRKIEDHKIQGITNGDLNVHGSGEVIVIYDTDNMELEFLEDIELFIDDEWVAAKEAFEKKLVIPDNYNTGFDIPHSELEREQGFNW